MTRRSGFQREVLSLYRRALRMVQTKPPSTRAKFLLFVRYNFHQNAANISPRQVGVIEHLMRQGRKQIEMYEDPSVKDCWVSKEMKEWNKQRT
ncbi:related to Found in Mitochondrial Proteome [Armillaria ostoyae]|uniref:Related to Found in Mitochondrial Proteome n=2 Tax=Armillaria TaxID=47424 RepID=A0A284RG11_ARMOS|nr:hypothetical protein ARMSODRAFT_951114 [Armillaria solidipes]SJL07691.1 related to Found in Mitochondrial Proteome [Armillaria ostoyae]